MSRRPASHAGSWYTNKRSELTGQLAGWLQAVEAPEGPARAVIAPHAGYSYSGPTAAHAYRAIDPATTRRIFVLGPSHHVYLRDCALTRAEVYETPVGDLRVDRATVEELRRGGEFSWMDAGTDADEHSIEMHLPYIAHVMRGRDVGVVPVLVGALSPESEARYGRLLAPYLQDPGTVFVASSDFCHWGRRFRYTYYDKRHGEICQSIEALDRMGMEHIENLDPAGFQAYQEEFQNTICGRHPIAVLLHAIRAHPQGAFQCRFVRYAQSSSVTRPDDSSVSYASAVITAGPGAGRA